MQTMSFTATCTTCSCNTVPWHGSWLTIAKTTIFRLYTILNDDIMLYLCTDAHTSVLGMTFYDAVSRHKTAKP